MCAKSLDSWMEYDIGGSENNGKWPPPACDDGDNK